MTTCRGRSRYGACGRPPGHRDGVHAALIGPGYWFAWRGRTVLGYGAFDDDGTFHPHPATAPTGEDWIIACDGGVSSRYATEAETRADLPAHPAGSTVEFQPPPTDTDAWACGLCDAPTKPGDRLCSRCRRLAKRL